MLICGIDEAGKGPVIGSLVVCGIKIDEKELKKLEKLGVKDSKLIIPKERERLYNKLTKQAEFAIERITALQIDEAMRSPQSNLIKIEAEKTANVLNKLEPNKAFIDCPSVNIGNYKIEVEKRLKIITEIVLEHKADLNYPIVGAASIIAKVTRDREIEELKQKIGLDFGSGYMSDEKTQRFLKENWNNEEFSSIFRKQWQSWQEMKRQKEQKNLFNF